MVYIEQGKIAKVQEYGGAVKTRRLIRLRSGMGLHYRTSKKQFDQYLPYYGMEMQKMNLPRMKRAVLEAFTTFGAWFHHELTDQTLCDVGAAGFGHLAENVFPDLEGDDCGFIE